MKKDRKEDVVIVVCNVDYDTCGAYPSLDVAKDYIANWHADSDFIEYLEIKGYDPDGLIAEAERTSLFEAREAEIKAAMIITAIPRGWKLLCQERIYMVYQDTLRD